MVDELIPTAEQLADSRAAIARLADEALPMLIRRLEQSELGEIEVRERGWRVRLRRTPIGGVAADVGAPVAARIAHPIASGISHGPPAQLAQRGVVPSPAVGYFTPRAGLEPKTALRNGDLIGHVDVLGVRQEVVSPHDGTFQSFEAQSGQAVEYGQMIARVETDV